MPGIPGEISVGAAFVACSLPQRQQKRVVSSSAVWQKAHGFIGILPLNGAVALLQQPGYLLCEDDRTIQAREQVVFHALEM